MNSIEFVTESNRIEGILRPPTDEEIEEHERFIMLPEITIADLEEFVGVYQPDAKIRDKLGLDVWVGNHLPPLGGPVIRPVLHHILCNMKKRTPYQTHVAYETLHPFTDGNGRSGRVLWAWQMVTKYHGAFPLGFLHTFYYQALNGAHAV